MRLILLGPPGCGKGTQAKLLSKRLNLEHIGTGDLLRAAIRSESPVGVRAKPFVEAGQLVPDEVVNDLVAERFGRDDRPKRFVLDGYPRRRGQAEFLDGVLKLVGLPIQAVLLIDVPDSEIVGRVTGRWSCPHPGCKATYHTLKNPPRRSGICDDCGTALVQRADDQVETVRARLVVYHKDTVGLIPHYRGQGLLHAISGEGEIEVVYQQLVQVLSGAEKGENEC